MNTYTTPTGIKVLLPQVPIEATRIGLYNFIASEYECTLNYFLQKKEYEIGLPGLIEDYTILGTCWREGGKLICDFDPRDLFINHVLERALEQMDSWLLSQGVEIKQGHKIVVIKVE